MESNTHWHEWREAVCKTGYTPALSLAAQRLLGLDRMTTTEVEQYFVRVMDRN